VLVLNEVTEKGVRRLELWPDDVLDVSNVPGAPIGSEVNTIDGRRYRVAEEVGEVFARLEDSAQRSSLARHGLMPQTSPDRAATRDYPGVSMRADQEDTPAGSETA
jgi:hypothetical protein